MQSLDFPDGDVFLSFGNSQLRHRVHKATLKNSIPFFTDLFDVASPNQDGDDIPTVQLPDNEDAFVLLLRSIYDQE